MNMLTSLKALLFSSAAVPGTAAAAAPGQGKADFAAMLSGSMEEALPAGAAAPGMPQADAEAPVAAVPDVQPDLDQLVQPAAHDHVPSGLAVAVAAGKGMPTALPPGLALGLVRRQPDVQPAPQPEGEPEAVAVEAGPQPAAAQPDAPVEAVEVKSSGKPHKAHQKKDGATEPRPLALPTVAETEAEPASKLEIHKEAEVGALTAVSPEAVPVIAPVVAVAPTPAAAPAPLIIDTAQAEGDQPVAPQPVMPAALPVAAGAQVAAPVATDIPVAAPQSTQPVELAAPIAVTTKDEPAAESPAPVAKSAAPSTPIVDGKPVKAEALALLQIVREQLSGRQSAQPVRVGEQVSAAASAKDKPAARQAEAVSVFPIAAQPFDAAPPASGIASQPMAAQAAAPSVPVVDLSASLGAQMVDMGVSGQWIDGLARDIAGLSANGAQGRFQIDTHHLGAVQVDIRQGGDGAAVSLTVASEAAEAALRQDSDRLKLDAGLAAVRISDVRVERAAPVAEAHRADTSNPSSSQQQPQQQGSQTASAWQQNGQNMGQPQGQQGRWQGRENNAFGPKGSADPAVLNHADAQPRAQDTVRARYA
jgi:hypothetical protein